MKITLIGTLSGQGGIQTHFYWLARCLLENGQKVQVISLSNEFNDNDIQRADELRRLGDFSIHTPRKSGSGNFIVALRIIIALRRFRPDVCIACGTGWNLFVPPIASFSGATKIFHEVMSGHSAGLLDSRQLVRYGYQFVVAQANAVGETFRREFRWQPPIPILPAFPEPLELTATLPSLKSKTVLSDKIRAAFFGRLAPHKGALWLAENWPHLKTYLSELHFFGTGPDEEKIREFVQVHHLQESIYLHGEYPTGQEHVNILSSFDLTLLPTKGSEGAPLVLLESMACGVPFIAYNVGGIPDYENPDCLIVDVNKTDSFITGVQQFSFRLQSGLINHSRLQNHYLESFSYKKISQRWTEFLSGCHEMSE